MKNNTPPPNGAVTTTPTVSDLIGLANNSITQSALAEKYRIDPSKFSRNLSGWAIAHVVALHSKAAQLQIVAAQLQEAKKQCDSLASDCNDAEQKLQTVQDERDGLVTELQQSTISRNELAAKLQDTATELQKLQDAATAMQSQSSVIAGLRIELQDAATQLQDLRKELQMGKTELQTVAGKLQVSENEKSVLKTALQTANDQLSAALEKIKPLEDFKKEHEEWANSNILERFLSGGWARQIVLAMLVFYEADVTRQLLIEKQIENPLVIACGIGMSFLVFASSRNIWGQVFIVGYSLFTSGCLFGIFSFDVGYVFLLAFPCLVAAVMKNRQ